VELDEWRKAKAPSRFFLVLEGVDSCADIWVNGKHIGYSQDSCLSCEFDITQALKSNQESSSSVPGGGGDDDDHMSCHTIAIRVLRWCDGSYLEVTLHELN
jgi:beta-galactosidase